MNEILFSIDSCLAFATAAGSVDEICVVLNSFLIIFGLTDFASVLLRSSIVFALRSSMFSVRSIGFPSASGTPFIAL